jgi:hypothetical protein
MRKILMLAVAGVAVLALAGAAGAAVTFDAATGTGFVGKGDVQTVFGWNNPALQANADSVDFRASSEVVTEVSWTCTNASNEHIQERERTTTTSVEGIVTSVARVRNQITGFNLTGYDGDVTESSDTEGPAVNSCPANLSSWYLSTPAGDPEVVSTGGGLQVSINGTDWFPIG